MTGGINMTSLYDYVTCYLTQFPWFGENFAISKE